MAAHRNQTVVFGAADVIGDKYASSRDIRRFSEIDAPKKSDRAVCSSPYWGGMPYRDVSDARQMDSAKLAGLDGE